MRLRHTGHSDQKVNPRRWTAIVLQHCWCREAGKETLPAFRFVYVVSQLRLCLLFSNYLAFMRQIVSWQLCNQQFCGERGVQRGVNGCGHVSQSFPMISCAPDSTFPSCLVPVSSSPPEVTCQFSLAKRSKAPIQAFSRQNIQQKWLQYTDKVVTFMFL